MKEEERFEIVNRVREDYEDEGEQEVDDPDGTVEGDDKEDHRPRNENVLSNAYEPDEAALARERDFEL